VSACLAFDLARSEKEPGHALISSHTADEKSSVGEQSPDRSMINLSPSIVEVEEKEVSVCLIVGVSSELVSSVLPSEPS
jgi:hypothetical protein